MLFSIALLYNVYRYDDLQVLDNCRRPPGLPPALLQEHLLRVGSARARQLRGGAERQQRQHRRGVLASAASPHRALPKELKDPRTLNNIIYYSI